MQRKQTQRTWNMTEGNPLKLILVFAIPLLIGNLFQQLYNLVDIIVAGYCLGDDALASIGATSSFYQMLLGFASGMNVGFSLMVSRAFGQKDDQKIKRAVAGSMLLNIAFAAVFMMMAFTVTRPMLTLLKTPTEIVDQSTLYLATILAGMPVTIAYNMEASVLRALGNSRTPLIFLMIASIGNIILDFVFIAGLKMGVQGAAAATVLAQFISVVLCLIHIQKNYPELYLTHSSFAIRKRELLELFTTGLSMGFMNSIYAIGSVTLQSAINSLGTVVITAHTAARKILEIGMGPISSIAMAASTYVSQNYGAGKFERIKSGVSKACQCCYVWSALFFVVFMLLGKMMIQLLTGTGDGQVIQYGYMNLKINLPFYIFLGPLIVLRNVLQSMGHRISPLFSSSIEMVFKLFAAAVLVPMFHYAGASIAEPFTWLLCMIFLTIIYRKSIKQYQE